MGLLLTKILPPSNAKPPPTSAHNSVPGSENNGNANIPSPNSVSRSNNREFIQKGNRRTSKNPKSPFSNPK